MRHHNTTRTMSAMLIGTSIMSLAGLSANVEATNRRAVVVTITNNAPENGTFQTPVWVGFHNGQFDSYDGGTFADTLPIDGSDAIERLAEDGTTGPISDDFDELVRRGAQATVASRFESPPFAPGERASSLFRLRSNRNRYFSYVSMVLPSNDFFVANGGPTSHEIFDAQRNFVGESFVVPGTLVDDAGTEVNDELPENTAFFGQQAPNTGIDENDVISTGLGGARPVTSFIPGGPILSTPEFANADFLAPGYETLGFRFTEIDLNASRFNTFLQASNEVEDVVSGAFGVANLALRANGRRVNFSIVTIGLTGPATAAHLHLGTAGVNGPVVADLSDSIINLGPVTIIFGQLRKNDIVGPLDGADRPVDELTAEMVGDQVYVNIHTDEFPTGEIRGQVSLVN
ncbi:MAG: spondin domain-containing protein [Planctomycetota bacterium]